MNLAHLHLFMNHLPFLDCRPGKCRCARMLRHRDELKKAAALTFVVVALLTVPDYFTEIRQQAWIVGDRLAS